MGLHENIYIAVDSCETAQEIWLRVRQMMKGSDIGIQEKKAKLFNKWEIFTSTDGKSTESYYHRFSKLMNDFKRNKHFPEKIVINLKFLNNLQLKWRRHVTIVHQTKDLHEADYTQLYDFLKFNQAEADCTAGYEYGTRQTNADGLRNQVVQNAVQNPGVQNVGNQNGLLVVPKEWVILLGTAQSDQEEEMMLIFRLRDLDEIEEVNANCILRENLQQATTSGTLTDKAPVYDSDGSAEVHHYDNCYNNDIFNIFIQEEQYSKILNPITEPHMIQQNNSNVISMESSVEHNRGTIEQHPATVDETRTYFESLYNNLAIEAEKVNSVNRKMKETNVD
ncbi:hypothetical protein Tco_1138881 [Tanacetum coccineum]